MHRYFKLLLLFFCLHTTFSSSAQCPVNIGFENGNFDFWDCMTGNITANNALGTNSIDLSPPGAPTGNIHTMLQNTVPQLLDMYGHFPVSCPNGSEYSIKLGNDASAKKAQRVSYTFTIPQDDDNYSIIYNYAVVFQDPEHSAYEQPKFTANVYDVTNGNYIGCSSFSYASAKGTYGFKLSEVGKDVYYKGWTPVTIKLSGYAGRTIRLEFTTNDCTRGGHFGYAYIDVNQNCSSPISGSTHCFNDTSQTLIAPYGFSGYRWFTGDFSQEIGNKLSIDLKPLPAAGTKYAVEITPFPGQGCTDTVYTSIVYSSAVINLQIPNEVVSCISKPIDITANYLTAGSTPNLSFTYYTDASLSEYLLTPKSIGTSGTYYIKAVNDVGCIKSQPVKLRITEYPVFRVLTVPPGVRRPYWLDLTTVITGDLTGVTITYWKDSLATIPLTDTRIEKSGRYFIQTTIEGGCSEIYGVNVNVEEAIITPPNAFSPNGDGTNDTWEIALLASLYPDCTVDIYNRAGQLLFHSIGYTKNWDGKYKGIDQSIGTYYYVIKARSDLLPIGGSVTIVR